MSNYIGVNNNNNNNDPNNSWHPGLYQDLNTGGSEVSYPTLTASSIQPSSQVPVFNPSTCNQPPAHHSVVGQAQQNPPSSTPFFSRMKGFLKSSSTQTEQPLTYTSVKEELSRVVKKAKNQELVEGSYSTELRQGLDHFTLLLNTEFSKNTNMTLAQKCDIFNDWVVDFSLHKDVQTLWDKKTLYINALKTVFFQQYLSNQADFYQNFLHQKGGLFAQPLINANFLDDLSHWHSFVSQKIQLNYPLEKAQTEILHKAFGSMVELIGSMNAIKATLDDPNTFVAKEPNFYQYNQCKWENLAYVLNLQVADEKKINIKVRRNLSVNDFLHEPSAPPLILPFNPEAQSDSKGFFRNPFAKWFNPTSVDLPVASTPPVVVTTPNPVITTPVMTATPAPTVTTNVETKKPVVNRTFIPATRFQPLEATSAGFEWLPLRDQIRVLENIQKGFPARGPVEDRIYKDLYQQHLRNGGLDGAFEREMIDGQLKALKIRAFNHTCEMTNKAFEVLKARQIDHKSDNEIKPIMGAFLNYANSTGLFNEGFFHGYIYQEGLDAKVEIPDWDREWGKWHTMDDAERFYKAYDRYKQIHLNHYYNI